MPVFLLSNRKWLAGVALVALLVAIGWKIAAWKNEADKVADFNAMVREHTVQQEKSHTTGINLETGLNDYKEKTRPIDKEVRNAPDPVLFDADSVRRTRARIEAGAAARQRAYPLP